MPQQHMLQAHVDLQHSLGVINDRCLGQFSVWSGQPTAIRLIAAFVRVRADSPARFPAAFCAEGVNL